MKTKNNLVLGSHKGIELIQNERGEQFYYSTHTKKTAIGVKGFARLVGCDPKSIQNLMVKLGVVKSFEMYTTQGLRMVNLLIEDDIAKVFEAIAKSRMKKTTKQRASEVSSRFIQAGFRLMALMEVAPEVVAIEAINKTTTTLQTDKIDKATQTQSNYLKSFHSLGDALKEHNCRYGVIHGFNNQLVGVENGKRPQMSEEQRQEMTVAQIFEQRALSRQKFSNRYEAENQAKEAGTQSYKLLKGFE